MDEADLLSDEIAIMAEGQLRCHGSSLSLKKKYGVGYQLTIIKNNSGAESRTEEGKEEEVVGESSALERNSSSLDEIVKAAVPSALVLSSAGTEISFQLPLGESAKFIPLFERLDNQITENIIESYGISYTTLEEVFLMVARGEVGISSECRTIENSSTERGVSSEPNQDSLDTSHDAPFRRHVRALFKKRVLNFRRDKKAW